MLYPPRPQNISIPAVVAGNILQNDDTSISAIDSGYDGTIVMRTQNQLAMIISPEQKTSINTEYTNSMLTVNNNSSTTSTIRLSYQDQYYFDGRITENGNALFIPSCDDQTLDPKLWTTFKKNFDIADHDGMQIGLRLGGILITASASEINYVDVPAGSAKGGKAVVLDSDKNFSGISNLTVNTLTGTLTTSYQPNIKVLDDVNIAGTLKIKGTEFDLSPSVLALIKVPWQGIAYANKALILDSDKNITGINSISANTITGTLSSGSQPNITSLSALTSLTNNGTSNLYGPVIVKTNGDQLSLQFSSSVYSTLNTTSNGTLVFRSVGKKVRVELNHDFVIAGHDGVGTGLMLGDQLVLATGKQLNYNKVVPGVAAAERSLVLDLSKNISGVNQLVATYIAGTIQTGAQPLITSVSTLNITGHNGNNVGLALNGKVVTSTADKLNYVDTTPGSAQSTKALIVDNLKNIGGINSLSATTVAGVLTTSEQPNIKQVNTLTIANHNGTAGLTLGSTLVTATGAQINALDVTYGTAAANKVMVMDGAKNFVGANTISANYFNGVLSTATQPNISQVNTLNIQTHDGSSIGLSLNGVLVTSTAAQLNRVNVTAGQANSNKALVLDTSFSITGINKLIANELTGVLATATQPNIRNLRSINIADHDGSTTGLALNGVLVQSTANQLNYVDVQQGVAAASKALVLDSTKNISNINSLTAIALSGVIQTASQPNITSVSRLNIMSHDGSTTGLSLNGTLVTATAVEINRVAVSAGVAASSKALVVDSSKNIQGINNVVAVNVYGTLGTAIQPNLSTVNVLDIATHNGSSVGLCLAGTLVTATADQINRVDTTSGTAAANKALVLDSFKNITGINSIAATSLVGTVSTSNQPNITLVNTLNIANHDGGSNGLRLKNVLVSATANQLNYTSVVPGTATAVRALVTNEYNSVSGVNTLSATKLSAEQLALSGVISNFNTGGVVIKTYSFTDMVGRMVDIQLLNSLTFSNFQPANMTSGYSSEIIGYICPQFSETYTFYITCNDRVRLWINGELILHSWAAMTSPRTSNTIFLNAQQWVPIYIQYQVDTGSIPYFLLEWASNNTARARVGTGRLAWDNNMPANTSKHFAQNAFTIYNTSTSSANFAKFAVDSSGDLVIDASGNDITLGSGDSLNIPAHNGTSQGLYLGGVLVQPTAYELNYLKVNPGSVSSSHALVVDASKSITGINSLSAVSIACDNLSASAFTISNLSFSGPLNNYNTGALLVRQITGPNVSGRVVSVDTISDINLNNYDPRELASNFSLDIIGYVLPQRTENYRFFAIANDRVRIWVNNQLVLNAWTDLSTGLEYTSDPILLTMGQWVPIYIQFQNVSGTSSLQVRWSSTSTTKSFIDKSFMAWDNSFAEPMRSLSSADQLTLFSSAVGLTSPQTGSIAVDANGNLSLSSKAGVVSVAASSNFNITTHNGTNGLQLSGTLVRATATELNYVAGVTPGTVTALKAMVLDSNRALSGFASISSTDLIGTIRTATQPFITSIGTLASTLNSSSDIVISSSNLLRFATDASACYIQTGSLAITNSSADLFIGTYGTTISASSRKLMIKDSGFVGIQSSSPTRALTVNGGGATYAMRLVNNNSTGTETAFCDIGVDSSSNLRVASNIIVGSTGTATLSVNSSGVMNISPSSGSLQIGNASNSTLPLEIGSTSFTLSSATGFINSEGSVGKLVPTASSYSLRTASSIIVNGTVCITSDRRLKENIQTLSYTKCRRFILESEPVQFSYKSDETKSSRCGLIAQDVARSDFSSLVKIAPHQGLPEEDGSPADAALNISYEEIIPILMTTTKATMLENDNLKKQVQFLNEQLALLAVRLSALEKNQ